MILYKEKKCNGLTLFDIDGWNLKNLEVIREADHIDILFLDEINRFACIIENKIKSTQHSNQLERYIEKAEEKYGKYKKLFVYLKPRNDEIINDSYIYVSYENIIELIQNLITNKKELLNDALLLIISNYKELLERKFMGNDKIKEICEQIYATHGNALRIIFDKIEDFKGGLDLCQIAVADLIKNKFVNNSSNYKLLCKEDTVRNILFTSKDLEQYKDNFKFRIWNAIMDKDFALVIDFNNIDNSKKTKICEVFDINRNISESQMRVSLGKILSVKDCDNCYNRFFKNDNKLSPDDEDKLLKKLEEKLSKDKLNKILAIMNETEY